VDSALTNGTRWWEGEDFSKKDIALRTRAHVLGQYDLRAISEGVCLSSSSSVSWGKSEDMTSIVPAGFETPGEYRTSNRMSTAEIVQKMKTWTSRSAKIIRPTVKENGC
jgi:hypothetical protein